MNATARERVLAAEALARDTAESANVAHTAACIAHAASILATATSSWKTLPPDAPEAIDRVGNQLEGLRRALGEMRTALRK